jgi:hypothetical protein
VPFGFMTTRKWLKLHEILMEIDAKMGEDLMHER